MIYLKMWKSVQPNMFCFDVAQIDIVFKVAHRLTNREIEWQADEISMVYLFDQWTVIIQPFNTSTTEPTKTPAIVPTKTPFLGPSKMPTTAPVNKVTRPCYALA